MIRQAYEAIADALDNLPHDAAVRAINDTLTSFYGESVGIEAIDIEKIAHGTSVADYLFGELDIAVGVDEGFNVEIAGASASATTYALAYASALLAAVDKAALDDYLTEAPEVVSKSAPAAEPVAEKTDRSSGLSSPARRDTALVGRVY